MYSFNLNGYTINIQKNNNSKEMLIMLSTGLMLVGFGLIGSGALDLIQTIITIIN